MGTRREPVVGKRDVMRGVKGPVNPATLRGLGGATVGAANQQVGGNTVQNGGLKGPIAELFVHIKGFDELTSDSIISLARSLAAKIDDAEFDKEKLFADLANSMKGLRTVTYNEEQIVDSVGLLTSTDLQLAVDAVLSGQTLWPAETISPSTRRPSSGAAIGGVVAGAQLVVDFRAPVAEKPRRSTLSGVKKQKPRTLAEHEAAKKDKDAGRADHERRVGITDDFFGLQVMELAKSAGLTPEEVKSLEALIGYSNKKRGPEGKAKKIDLVQMRAANAQQVAASGPARQKLSELVDKYSSSFGEVNDEKKKKEYQRRLALLETLLSDSNTVRGMQTAVYDRVGVNTSKTDPRSEIGIKARKEARGIRVGILKALDRIFKLAIEDRQAR